MKKKHSLISTSGDCHTGGLANEPTILHFGDCHKAIVLNFLRAQLEWEAHSYFAPEEYQYKKDEPLLKQYKLAAQKLWDAGIFTNKWQERTKWELQEAMTQEVEYFRCWNDNTWDTDFIRIPKDSENLDEAVVKASYEIVWKGEPPVFVGFYSKGDLYEN